MPTSIYDQMARGLDQAIKYGDRAILFRGEVIPCAVLLGNTSTRLVVGGLETDAIAHVKIPRAAIDALGGQEPHTNEAVVFPAVAKNGLEPRNLMIYEVVAEEYSYSFTLTDPSH